MSQSQPVSVSQDFSDAIKAARGFIGKAFGALALSLAALVGSTVCAEAEDRALKLYFTHTGEKATITYKRNGRLDMQGIAKINRFLRDWRRNENARMDPRLLDVIWEIYDRTGTSDYIHVVSAYRSPATNAMLRGRSRSTGVAKKSQHMLGKAMDFYIPGVKLATLRALAMQMQSGGVGYYPTSGSPFVHVDVGNVRAWPRMSRQELARLFPRGRTMHLPASGGPLPGYDDAVADYRRRVGAKTIEVAATSADDDDDAPSVPVTRRSIVTAMLPTPKDRPEAAKAILAAAAAPIPALAPTPTPTLAPPQTPAAPQTPAFADLARLAIPRPGTRPQSDGPEAQIDDIETASIDPAAIAAPLPMPSPTAATPAVSENPLAALAPSIASSIPAAFAPGRLHPASTVRLAMPKAGSIASLPITGPEFEEEEDEFDAQDALIAWAISKPGTPAGMSAPVVTGRTLTDLTAPAARTEPLPAAISEDFDFTRFWSKG